MPSKNAAMFMEMMGNIPFLNVFLYCKLTKKICNVITYMGKESEKKRKNGHVYMYNLNYLLYSRNDQMLYISHNSIKPKKKTQQKIKMVFLENLQQSLCYLLNGSHLPFI